MSESGSNVASGTTAELRALLEAVEGEHVEFKEARNSYDEDKLAKYCCAFANEGGGKLVLGVKDGRPRVVVGTSAYQQLESVRQRLLDRIPLRIEVRELHAEGNRVLMFDVPSRPLGTPIKHDGVYWARNGEALVPMPETRLHAIFGEVEADFTSRVCPGLSLEDLDPAAIEEFRQRWIRKSGNVALAGLTPEQLLFDAEAITADGVTYAALILLGTRAALGRHLAQAEVIFEYRAGEQSGPAQQRKEYRQGFFSWYDDLWKSVNARNDVQHYQDGLFVYDIPTVEEGSLREALLNAVSHRDYQLGGSVFVRQFPRRIELDSPGGLPRGITPENILDRTAPRNRRVAELFAKCGLVERSGQGMNRMFDESIRRGKQRPDLVGSDQFLVRLTLHGEVRDPSFVRALEKIAVEGGSPIGTRELLVLDLVHREAPIPAELASVVGRLIEMGAVERLGRGKQSRLLLSRRFYSITGRRGDYTRKRGLDRETNKALLLQHLVSTVADGCQMAELQRVQPALSRQALFGLLNELREEGRVTLQGVRRWARWSASPAAMTLTVTPGGHTGP